MQINVNESAWEMGGKGYQLFRMKEMFPIPPFISIMFNDINEINDCNNIEKILSACRTLSDNFFAIRSSATCEDSSEASFAGMFDTLLNVKFSEIITSIKSVLQSVDNQRVRDYCESKKIAYDKIKMRIVVQKQVCSRISGVCFTKFQNDPNRMIIEGIYGLGEMLVSGRVDPDTVIFDRKTNDYSYNVGYQTAYIGSYEGDINGIVVKPSSLPYLYRKKEKIKEAEIYEIVETAIAIEKKLGFLAADIEWAYEGEKLYIIQARPYTGFRQEN